MSTTRTMVVALVIAALCAPATQAQPADMHASTAIAAAKKQDLRSPDARDAARQPRAVTETAAPQLTPAPPVASDPGVDWLPIAIGAGAGLAAIAALAALGSRRVRRTRVAA